MAKILVVEDDAEMLFNVKSCLEGDGYLVDTAKDGQTAFGDLQELDYDLLILDWDLPGLSGIEIARRYRERRGQAPILMLTAKDRIEDKGVGFGAGADDYLTKPFLVKELLLRVAALLRRPREITGDVLAHGELQLDRVKRLVLVDGAIVDLRLKEYQILELFMLNLDRVFTTEEIARKLWPTTMMCPKMLCVSPSSVCVKRWERPAIRLRRSMGPAMCCAGRS